jgi:uncharacterized membrane protein
MERGAEPAWASGIERIAGISDDVFAFAMTLLVIEIAIPTVPSARADAELLPRLINLWPHWVSIFASFTIIALYWVAHHQMFTSIRRYDSTFIALNFAVLFTIVLQPFATELLGEYGHSRVVVSLYALLLAVTALLLRAMSWYANRGFRLVNEDVEPRLVRQRRAQGIAVAAVFLTSIGLAQIQPALTPIYWVGGFVVAQFVTNRVFRPRKPAATRTPSPRMTAVKSGQPGN